MMITTWMLVAAVLLDSADGARSHGDIQSCAWINTSSSVVRLGSPLTATCVISEHCPLLIGKAVQIEWRLDSERILSSPAVNVSNEVSRIFIPSFNRTKTALTCCIQDNSIILAGVEIRAGNPPEMPQNLSCQTNLTDPITLNCRWDPRLQDNHLPTKYTLHTEIRDLNQNHTYELPPDVHHYVIPRSDFGLFNDMKIYVKAENDLGEATSSILLEPVSAACGVQPQGHDETPFMNPFYSQTFQAAFQAKFDQPSIGGIVSNTFGCFKLKWRLPLEQAWMCYIPLNLQIRLKTADSDQWSNPPIAVNQIKDCREVQNCHLLHGTQYLAQIRVRYKQSPWSEWSSSKSGVTLETAPTGRLDSLIKVSRNHTSKNLNIQLFWKPSKQFRANSQNLSYVVSKNKLYGEMVRICATSEKCCAFQLSSRVRRVYLSAVNSQGKSSPTEVRIYQSKAHGAVIEVSAVPYEDRSFQVKWTAEVTSGLTGYVVEWKPLLEPDLCHTHFELVNKSQSSLIITGSFEPYKPYGISVYPRFKDGMGPPQTVNAYLKEKAPSVVPKLHIKDNWTSDIEIYWDEIPLEKRNGLIKSYKVFYWDKKGNVKVVSADAEDRRVILKDLNTASMYEAFLMVSTSGGSLNGSEIIIQGKPFDAVTAVLAIMAGGALLALLIIFIVSTCLTEHKKLNQLLWPAVPDPANSSIKRWSSESTQFTHSSWDNEETDPMYLSHLSILDLPTKLSKEEDDIWQNDSEDTSDIGESIFGSPFIPTYSGSNSESFPYATVLVSSSCNAPVAEEPHVYLRSESTQPLLESEERFTPKFYQNVANDGMPMEQCFFGPCDDITEGKEDTVIDWEDFPFLCALAMNEIENDKS